jgi:hypothetical protein
MADHNPRGDSEVFRRQPGPHRWSNQRYDRQRRNPLQEQDLFEKIRALPEEKIAEVADFVDFLHHWEANRRLVQAASLISEAALRKVWDNDDDADYDLL